MVRRRFVATTVSLVLSSLLGACNPGLSLNPIAEPTTTAVPTVIPSPTPPSAADIVKQGDALLLESDFADAEIAYRKAISTDVEYAPAYAALSALDNWLGKVPDALTQARKAVELAPESGKAQIALADAQISVHANEEALKAAQKAWNLSHRAPPLRLYSPARIYLITHMTKRKPPQRKPMRWINNLHRPITR